MPRRLTLLSFLAALLFLPSPSAAARPASGYSVTTVSHGIRLTLSLPRNTYPRNALVRVTLVARNIARKPVSVIRENITCGDYNPYVEAKDSTGNISQLPTLTRFLHPPCPAPVSGQLLPGHAIKRQRYVILSDRMLVATFMVGSLQRSIKYLSTPPLSVSQSTGQAPHVVLHVDGEQAFADVAPAGPTKGPLRFIQSVHCPTNGGFEVVTHYDWQPADGTRITAGCSPLSEWHAIAGWLNQPVATIDYVPPADTHC